MDEATSDLISRKLIYIANHLNISYEEAKRRFCDSNSFGSIHLGNPIYHSKYGTIYTDHVEDRWQNR